MSNYDPLTVLEQHFKAIERFPIRIPGVEGEFFAKPLSFEESLRLVHALRERDGGKQARMHAELIVAKIETAEGHRAFTADKHFSAEDRLVRACPPSAIAALVEQFQDHLEQSAEDLEKKPGPPGAQS